VSSKAKRHPREQANRVGLVRAAAACGYGYARMRDAVLRGLVLGGQDADSRGWWVDRHDLKRFLREREEKHMTNGGTEPGIALGEALDEELSRSMQRTVDRLVGAATAPDPAMAKDPVAFLVACLPKKHYPELARHLFADPDGRAAIEAALRDGDGGRAPRSDARA
jgi:hypothetical protein